MFAVGKKNQPMLLKFMKEEGGWDLLRRIPHLRGAYLLHNRDRRTQYLWITIWSSSSGLKKAIQSQAWKRLYAKEVSSGVIFSGHYQRKHYDVLLQHSYTASQ